jgi:predicted TIM-barrel fold metal-dependent hydrolase
MIEALYFFMRIDIHCHMSQAARPCRAKDRFPFEPPEDYAPYDSYWSHRFIRGRIGFEVSRWLLKVGRKPDIQEQDAEVEAALLRHLLGAKLVDRAVILAMDQYHTDAGEPLGQTPRGGTFGTDLYVSNTYVRELWRRHPDKLLYAAAIHPYRNTAGFSAIEMLEQVAADGAVMIKWLPLSQNIDVEDERTVAFLRRAAQLGMPMLIHCGEEFTLGNMHPKFADPKPLLGVLRGLRREGNMPTVIVAHVATPSTWPIDRGQTYYDLVDGLMGEFADAPLYADIAALGIINKARWMFDILKRTRLQRKLVHGSDFPVLTMPWFYRRRLGPQYRRVMQYRSWLDRDIALKMGIGLDPSIFTRASQLLSERIAHADHLANRLDHSI